MKKNNSKQQKQEKSKPSKKEQILEWLKFLSLVLIVLPPCTFIFEGFNPYGLIFVGVGVVLFVVNFFIAYSMQKKQESVEKQVSTQNNKNIKHKK